MGESRIPLRESDGDAGRDEGPFARPEGDVDAREEIGTRVAGIGVGRQRQAGVETSYGYRDAFRADPHVGSRPWLLGLRRPLDGRGVGQAAHSRQTILPPLSLASWLRWCTK